MIPSSVAFIQWAQGAVKVDQISIIETKLSEEWRKEETRGRKSFFVHLFWAIVWEYSRDLDQHRGSKNREVKELLRFGICMSWLMIWLWGKVSVWFPIML